MSGAMMRGLSSILALLALMTPARASVFLYDGAIQGQLDIYDNPVELQLVPGINVIKGTAIAANLQLQQLGSEPLRSPLTQLC
jgi:hypothetical protein